MTTDTSAPPQDFSALLSRFLDADLSADECHALLERLRGDADARDSLTIMQLVRDAVGGVPALDDGYTLRILKRLKLR
jgi:hypothetical protein